MYVYIGHAKRLFDCITFVGFHTTIVLHRSTDTNNNEEEDDDSRPMSHFIVTVH